MTMLPGKNPYNKCEQDACPIAKNMDMTRSTAAEKRATAVALYGADWTMQRIAEKLGVSTATVGRYLEEFSHNENSSHLNARPQG